MKNLLLILLCFPLLVFSQDEKRLALVIGNANYGKGELKNPVNDALLITKTLDSLDFDIILDTNISDRSSLINTIREFGDRRENYDVGFVYYAGHGVQVNGENYLLPTKCEDCKNKEYNTEDDIIDYAVSVQKIMRFLTSIDNQVNILILDACRDNPFERNWNRTRSLKGGGLAKISPPMGSLIAFSTDVGNTAADGDGENSIYCQSLVQNMLKENTDLNQVFRNVRRDVLSLTNNQQSPVEESKLTGDAFYLVISDFKKEFEQIALLKNKEQYFEALEIISKIIFTKPKTISAYRKRADLYTELKKYDKAEADLTKSIELDPENSTAYNNRGTLYCYYLAQYDKAEADFTKAIELDPRNSDTYNNRGYLHYYYLNQYDKGEADFTKAIELDPKDPAAYNNRGRLYRYLQKYDKAEADLTKAIELDPENSTAYNNRGYLHDYYLNQYDKAEADYTKAIEWDPKDPAAYSNRGRLYFSLEKYDKAEADLTKAIELDPKDPAAYHNRGYMYCYLEQYNKAEVDLNKAIELDPKHIAVYHTRGYLYAILEQYDKAEADFTKTIELDPDILSYHNRGNLYKELKQYDKAEADYTKAIEWDPKDPEAYYERGSFYYHDLEKYDKAEADLTKAIELDPKDPAAYHNRGRIYYDLGQYDKAEADYTKAIELEPEALSFLRRGILFVKLSNFQLALDDYNKVIEILDDKKTDGYFYRAKFYIHFNKYEEALSDYKKTAKIDPKDPESYYHSGLIYYTQKKYLRAINMFTTTINKLNDFGFREGMLSDNAYYVSDPGFDVFSSTTDDVIHEEQLTKVLLKRGEAYSKIKEIELMCEDYKKACDLGDCEMFNKNCK